MKGRERSFASLNPAHHPALLLGSPGQSYPDTSPFFSYVHLIIRFGPSTPRDPVHGSRFSHYGVFRSFLSSSSSFLVLLSQVFCKSGQLSGQLKCPISKGNNPSVLCVFYIKVKVRWGLSRSRGLREGEGMKNGQCDSILLLPQLKHGRNQGNAFI